MIELRGDRRRPRGTAPGIGLGLLLALCLCATRVEAGEARVAVAANFTQAAREIGVRFAEISGHRVRFSFGSTGQLYAQISQAAPFDVYLAADQVRPRRAVQEGFAVAGSRFTYVTGRIALYSADPGRVAGADTLRDGDFTRLAIANPVTAPYGAAAMQVLRALDVHAQLAPRIVQGHNVAQTYQFVATGNAELGFVALSQIATHDRGSRWRVPVDLYTPIAQDAVLLLRASDNVAARDFHAFLRSDEARAVIRRFGYGPGS